MSTSTLDQPLTAPIAQGYIPYPLALLEPDSNPSLLINAPGIHRSFEFHVVGSPIIENNKITAQFIVDDDVYLELNLIGQSSEHEANFKVGQFSLFYRIEEGRPRAHFVANTLMSVMGLAGKIDLKISAPEISTNLNIETSLLEISKMLHRRQMAYRLMVIERATGKQFLLPSAMSERELERIAFVYHAIVERAFIWSSGSSEHSIPATQENALLFAQLVQPFSWSIPLASLNKTVLDQTINLGLTTVTIEDAVVKNLDEIRKQLEARDNQQVTLEIRSLSGQVKYEFTETRYSSDILWEPKIQTLIDLESCLDDALVARYHALAASTLEGLTEEEKTAITARPELDEQAF